MDKTKRPLIIIIFLKQTGVCVCGGGGGGRRIGGSGWEDEEGRS